jgi:hypothetical protein
VIGTGASASHQPPSNNNRLLPEEKRNHEYHVSFSTVDLIDRWYFDTDYSQAAELHRRNLLDHNRVHRFIRRWQSAALSGAMLIWHEGLQEILRGAAGDVSLTAVMTPAV